MGPFEDPWGAKIYVAKAHPPQCHPRCPGVEDLSPSEDVKTTQSEHESFLLMWQVIAWIQKKMVCFSKFTTHHK